MNTNDIKKEFQGRFLELRKLFNSWDLLPGWPKNAFDALHHQILGHLYKGGDLEKITRVLHSELIVHYGLSPAIEDSEKRAREIIEWWNLKNSM